MPHIYKFFYRRHLLLLKKDLLRELLNSQDTRPCEINQMNQKRFAQFLGDRDDYHKLKP
jgi:hypothetical protein